LWRPGIRPDTELPIEPAVSRTEVPIEPAVSRTCSTTRLITL
jgi:hypothetical protein